MTVFKRLDLEEVGAITVARFVDRKILDEANIQSISAEMFALVEVDGRKKLILDFSNVEYLSDAMYGKFLMLGKKMKAANGKLRFCSLRPELYEVFVVTRLNQVFEIKSNREEALKDM